MRMGSTPGFAPDPEVRRGLGLRRGLGTGGWVQRNGFLIKDTNGAAYKVLGFAPCFAPDLKVGRVWG